MGDTPLLRIEDLHVTYARDAVPVWALRGVSLDLRQGEIVAVVGESGAGKTTLALAPLMLFPRDVSVQGHVCIEGTELVGAPPRTLRETRGKKVGLVPQGSGTGLNPVRTVASQLAETLERRMGQPRSDATTRTLAVARRVRLDESHLVRYPHQLSGGERQRATLALALACEPKLLVLDEPTSGLDTEARAAFLQLIADLRNELGSAVLLVTHDLAAAAQAADVLTVMYAGIAVERGQAQAVVSDPQHPYTRDLLAAYPSLTTQKDLRPIRGAPPESTHPPRGCPYHPRCTQSLDECASWEVKLERIGHREIACMREGLVTVLKAVAVSKSYAPVTGRSVEAVAGVSLSVRAGEVIGIVGETGSGKSTLARVLLGLEEADTGRVLWDGCDIATFSGERRLRFRREAAMVFQNPYEAVSPRFTVLETVREPLDIHGIGSVAARASRVADVLAQVGLPLSSAFLQRLAHQLSGGELQRLAVARALVLEPRLLVADEATSQLDASEQARLLVLLKDLQLRLGMSMIVISHEVALVRKVADRIAVMHRGTIVEQGPSSRLLTHPRHEYTIRLIAAAPRFDAQLA